MTTRRIRGARKGAGWISGVRLEPEPDYLIRQRMELRKRPFHFDSIGLSLLVITVVCWEVMLSKGQEWDWLGDPFWRVQTLAVLFAAGLIGLIVWELRQVSDRGMRRSRDQEILRSSPGRRWPRAWSR